MDNTQGNNGGAWTTGNAAQAIDYATLPIQQLQTVKREGLSESNFVIVRDRLLVEWNVTKEELEKAKEREMELRKAFVDFAFDQNKTSGTENLDLGNGYKAKSVKKENYGFVKNADGKIDEKAIDEAVSKLAKTPNGGLIAERLVKWSPTLSVSEYKLLSAEQLKIVNKVIVVSQGAPTLEIIEPKNK